MNELRTCEFPDLPQVPLLRKAAENLWKHPSVRAVWLGGSFAGKTPILLVMWTYASP
jgi:hypothetical protein